MRFPLPEPLKQRVKSWLEWFNAIAAAVGLSLLVIGGALFVDNQLRPRWQDYEIDQLNRKVAELQQKTAISPLFQVQNELSKYNFRLVVVDSIGRERFVTVKGGE